MPGQLATMGTYVYSFRHSSSEGGLAVGRLGPWGTQRHPQGRAQDATAWFNPVRHTLLLQGTAGSRDGSPKPGRGAGLWWWHWQPHPLDRLQQAHCPHLLRGHREGLGREGRGLAQGLRPVWDPGRSSGESPKNVITCNLSRSRSSPTEGGRMCSGPKNVN